MKRDFEQLANETLAKIKEFGIKSKSVYESFRRACRMLHMYLEENNLEFSQENGERWLLEIHPCEPMKYSQYVTYLALRRSVFMLVECQNGNLNSWKVYHTKTAARPKTKEYLQFLYLHEQRLKTDNMASATIKFSMRVDSDFLIYLETCGTYDLDKVSPHDVVGYFAQDKFAERKPEGIRAYACKLKSFLTFLEESGAISEKKLSRTVPKVFAKQESIVTVLSDKAARAIKKRNSQA